MRFLITTVATGILAVLAILTLSAVATCGGHYIVIYEIIINLYIKIKSLIATVATCILAVLAVLTRKTVVAAVLAAEDIADGLVSVARD